MTTRRFANASDRELVSKVISLAHSEMGDALNEFCERAVDSAHRDLEKIYNDPPAVTLLQGRIAQLRDLLNLLNPSAPLVGNF